MWKARFGQQRNAIPTTNPATRTPPRLLPRKKPVLRPPTTNDQRKIRPAPSRGESVSYFLRNAHDANHTQTTLLVNSDIPTESSSLPSQSRLRLRPAIGQ